MIARENSSGWLACWWARRVLQSYLDGMLAAAAAERVARHLKDCPRCTHEAETYRAIKNSLRRRRTSPGAVQRLRDFSETLHQDPEE